MEIGESLSSSPASRSNRSPDIGNSAEDGSSADRGAVGRNRGTVGNNSNKDSNTSTVIGKYTITNYYMLSFYLRKDLKENWSI